MAVAKTQRAKFISKLKKAGYSRAGENVKDSRHYEKWQKTIGAVLAEINVFDDYMEALFYVPLPSGRQTILHYHFSTCPDEMTETAEVIARGVGSAEKNERP